VPFSFRLRSPEWIIVVSCAKYGQKCEKLPDVGQLLTRACSHPRLAYLSVD